MLRAVLVFGGTKSRGLELMSISRYLSQGHRYSREVGEERDEEMGINELEEEEEKRSKEVDSDKRRPKFTAVIVLSLFITSQSKQKPLFVSCYDYN